MTNQPKDLVQTIHFKGYTNKECEFFPCHKGVKDPEQNFNCLFCYCPLIFTECPGPYKVFEDKHGMKRKDCTDCNLPHNGIKQSWSFIQKWLEQPIIWDTKEQKRIYLDKYKGFK